MTTHPYTPLSNQLPAIPILPLHLHPPATNPSSRHKIQGILDTGSDCTLIPIPDLIRVNARVIDRAIRVPVCGQNIIAIPYAVGITFDTNYLSACSVFGCSIEELGELSIIGRDLMNRYQILFNGSALEFTVF
jgi:hypothetical protein